MGENEVEEGDRPTYPDRITSAEVLFNPFDDMEVRDIAKMNADAKPVTKKRKAKKVKDLNVLSFGDEHEEDEKAGAATLPPQAKKRVRSAHDVAENDPTLCKEIDQDVLNRECDAATADAVNMKDSRRRAARVTVDSRDSLKAAVEAAAAALGHRTAPAASGGGEAGEGGGGRDFEQRMREQLREKKREAKARQEEDERMARKRGKQELKDGRDEFARLRDELKASRRAAKVRSRVELCCILSHNYTVTIHCNSGWEAL
jgi:peptidyl-prolyl cis-trans isomerase SDCCAG10